METDKPMVNLRPFEVRDLEEYRAWVNNSEIGMLVDRILPVSKLEHERWYSGLMTNRNAVVFAIEVESEYVGHPKYIGNVWLWNIDWRHRKAEVRILIGDKACQEMGYGTDVLTQITKFAFNKLNLHRLYAYIISGNGRAEKAFARVGFIHEGILLADRFIDGEYRDVLVMGITK